MYWLTPFRYLLEGFLSALTHDIPVRCLPREMARFTPPNGTTCAEYAGRFAERAGGYVVNGTDGGYCGFCQARDGDQFVCFLLPSLSLSVGGPVMANGANSRRSSISSTTTSGGIMYASPLPFLFLPISLMSDDIGRIRGVRHFQFCGRVPLLLALFTRGSRFQEVDECAESKERLEVVDREVVLRVTRCGFFPLHL